jgi:hypothetical protein
VLLHRRIQCRRKLGKQGFGVQAFVLHGGNPGRLGGFKASDYGELLCI